MDDKFEYHIEPEEVMEKEDREAIQAGLRDIERGDIRPWSQVKDDFGW